MSLKIEDLEGKNTLVKVKDGRKKNKLVREDKVEKNFCTIQVISLWLVFIIVAVGFSTLYFISISQHFGNFSKLPNFKQLVPYTLVIVLTSIVTYALTKKK